MKNWRAKPEFCNFTGNFKMLKISSLLCCIAQICNKSASCNVPRFLFYIYHYFSTFGILAFALAHYISIFITDVPAQIGSFLETVGENSRISRIFLNNSNVDFGKLVFIWSKWADNVLWVCWINFTLLPAITTCHLRLESRLGFLVELSENKKCIYCTLVCSNK